MTEEAVNSIVELGKYGTVGVIIALILLVGFSFFMFYKFANHHSKASNEAINNNTKVLSSIQTILELKLK